MMLALAVIVVVGHNSIVRVACSPSVFGAGIWAAHPARIPAREHSISHGNTRAGSSHGASCIHDHSECARGLLQWMWCAPLNDSSAVNRRKRRVRADTPRADSASFNLVDGLYGGSAVCLVQSKYPCADGLLHIHVSARLYWRMSECAAAVACVGHACAILSPIRHSAGCWPSM